MIPPSVGYAALFAMIPLSFFAGYHAGLRSQLDDVLEDEGGKP